jgi:putative N6-adenine-specific DNA methylase
MPRKPPPWAAFSELQRERPAPRRDADDARPSRARPAAPAAPRVRETAAYAAVRDLAAICSPGFEAVVAEELRALGLEVLSAAADGGVVEWRGGPTEVLRANLHLRAAERVLLRLGTFRATHFAQLRDKAGEVPWEQWLRPGRPVVLKVSADTSKLYHERAIAERVQAALEDRLGGAVRRIRASDEEEGENAQLILVRLHKDECTLSLDSSGARLHRRGWRQAVAKAPLRETFAAALLRLSGWDPTTPFGDPFCGSGTLAIEAALRARRIAPGLHRPFAFESWTLFEPAPWRQLCEQARADMLPHAPPIFASDRDAGAVASARANAERAGVAADIQFEVKSVSDFAPPPGCPPGAVVTNPPYGIRIRGGPDLRNLYARFGQVARARFPGWGVCFLCAHPAHAHAAGCDLRDGPWYNQGGIRVKALRLTGAAG